MQAAEVGTSMTACAGQQWTRVAEESSVVMERRRRRCCAAWAAHAIQFAGEFSTEMILVEEGAQPL